MRIREIIAEGGWADVRTQGTKITPTLLAAVVQHLRTFEQHLNATLSQKGLPPIRVGRPVGSGTYYERDLEQDPEKEYGDIDVQFVLPRIPELTMNQNQQAYYTAVREFCNATPGYSTNNGANIIIELGQDRYVQVDLVATFTDSVEFSDILSPEWKVKGVLSASILSALAEVTKLSISSSGIYAKTVDGQLVKFSTQKNTELHRVSISKTHWAVDVAKFLGATKLSPTLKQNPGLKDEVRNIDTIASIRGIAESLELSGLVNAAEFMAAVRASYLSKVDKVVNSSKFDKAETPDAIAKAEKTKRLLSTKSAEIAGMIK